MRVVVALVAALLPCGSGMSVSSVVVKPHNQPFAPVALGHPQLISLAQGCALISVEDAHRARQAYVTAAGKAYTWSDRFEDVLDCLLAALEKASPPAQPDHEPALCDPMYVWDDDTQTEQLQTVLNCLREALESG